MTGLAPLSGTVASRYGEYQLAGVLAGEQLGQNVREGANAALEDVFAGDQPALAQPPVSSAQA
jgi:hypothetical protein